MSDEDKTFSGSFVLDLRVWWRQAHTLYRLFVGTDQQNFTNETLMQNVKEKLLQFHIRNKAKKMNRMHVSWQLQVLNHTK